MVIFIIDNRKFTSSLGLEPLIKQYEGISMDFATVIMNSYPPPSSSNLAAGVGSPSRIPLTTPSPCCRPRPSQKVSRLVYRTH